MKIKEITVEDLIRIKEWGEITRQEYGNCDKDLMGKITSILGCDQCKLPGITNLCLKDCPKVKISYNNTKYSNCRNNPYRQSRLKAKLSMVSASRKLFIGVRSLAYYEDDTRIPSDDIVELMRIVYKDPDLWEKHLKIKGKEKPGTGPG